MLTKKDKIEYFKRECKNMHYYKEKVTLCNERLEELATSLQGISSPQVQDVVYENASNPYKSNKLYLMMEKEKIMKERQSYITKINYVNGKLMEIHSTNDQNMIKDLYLYGIRHECTAKKYGYTRDGMYKRVDKVLGKIL